MLQAHSAKHSWPCMADTLSTNPCRTGITRLLYSAPAMCRQIQLPFLIPFPHHTSANLLFVFAPFFPGLFLSCALWCNCIQLLPPMPVVACSADCQCCTLMLVPPQAASFLASAPVHVFNCTGVTLQSVTIAHSGHYGIWIDGNSSEINVDRCLVNDVGASGLRIGRGRPLQDEPDGARTGQVTVTNSTFIRGSQVWMECPF